MGLVHWAFAADAGQFRLVAGCLRLVCVGQPVVGRRSQVVAGGYPQSLDPLRLSDRGDSFCPRGGGHFADQRVCVLTRLCRHAVSGGIWRSSPGILHRRPRDGVRGSRCLCPGAVDPLDAPPLRQPRPSRRRRRRPSR